MAGSPTSRMAHGWNCCGRASASTRWKPAGLETPVEHFTEWLAEWGRDVRRKQRGLLLLTAHRAMGLEFDHVVVLDGGWKPCWQG